jgi:hypothetical protein
MAKVTTRDDAGAFGVMPLACIPNITILFLLSYPNLRIGSWSDTHKNSTTMGLYGYDLTQYVVETSLGVPTYGVD